jgi:hypothetical protein
MKVGFPSVRISPFGTTCIFHSTNNIPNKLVGVHGPISEQDIQEVLPSIIQKAVAIIVL